MSAISNQVPDNYVVPSFPSLYWPTTKSLTDLYGSDGSGSAYYLYYRSDIWRFTFYWTLIIYGVVHTLTAGFAIAMQWRGWVVRRGGFGRGIRGMERDPVATKKKGQRDDWWKTVWVIPVVYLVIGALEGVVTGSTVGIV